MQQAQEQGLSAQQDVAFGDILNGARQRGLGFSGIPLGEQAKYTATTYLPALANLKQSFNERGTSLSDALNSLNLGENQYAQTLRQSELDRDEQQRQFNAQLQAQREQAAAASRASASGIASPSFGGGSQAPSSAGQMAQRKDGGFAFVDSKGTPISAAKYAQLNNIPIGTLLYQMGQAGDRFAAQTYNAIKAAPGVAARPASLFWGA